MKAVAEEVPTGTSFLLSSSTERRGGMPRGSIIDLAGRVFGKLTVIERSGTYSTPGGWSVPIWRCHCTCGREAMAYGSHLRSGRTRSCGCGGTVGDAVKYRGAHQRVTRLRGSASTHECVDCGEPAYDWSYVGGCPRERVSDQKGSNGFAYSPNPERYVPRCKSCHKKFDTNKAA